jgi:hypothetical protein
MNGCFTAFQHNPPGKTKQVTLAAGKDSFWWGEATDEPDLARQSVATTAREDARPTEMANCVHDHAVRFKLSAKPLLRVKSARGLAQSKTLREYQWL